MSISRNISVVLLTLIFAVTAAQPVIAPQELTRDDIFMAMNKLIHCESGIRGAHKVNYADIQLNGYESRGILQMQKPFIEQVLGKEITQGHYETLSHDPIASQLIFVLWIERVGKSGYGKWYNCAKSVMLL